MSPHEHASAITAHKIHVLRCAAGHNEDPSAEALAGAIMEADTACEIRSIRNMIADYIKAQAQASR